ncbi:hypothetical protein ACTFIR_004470 [Dictyostelium discoideum]
MNIIKSNKKNKKNKINNENLDNSKIFFKVWRNSYIRYQIFQHLRLYNIHKNEITLTNEQLEKYKYLNYCRSIYLVSDKIDSSFLKDKLPDSVEHLSFVYYFNQPILNIIDFNFNSNYHCNLKSITFGYDFNQEIKETALPRSLESLKFGRLFNQELSETSFKNQINLKSIEFGAKFNNKGKPIKVGVFPKSIESLKFGFHFNSFFDARSLPNGLKLIELGSNYYQDLNQEDILPRSLTSLSLSNEYKIPITLKTIKSLPNLMHLDYPGFILPFGSNDEVLPSLKSLRSFIEWNDDDVGDVGGSGSSSNNSKLPSSLNKLTICGTNKIFKNISIPIGLKEIYIKSLLTFDSFHNGKGNGDVDISDLQLEKMTIDIQRVFPEDIKLGLPKFSIPTFKTLEILYLNSEFTQDIFPSTITSLTLDAYNMVFNSYSLPKSLKHLKLPNYNQPFTNIDSFPWRTLEELEFGMPFFQPFPPSISFKNLKSLTIGIDCFMSFSKNSTVDTLFPVLESIVFIIPQELKYIISTDRFFQLLPISIKHLKLGKYEFDKPFNDESIIWPPKLTTISIPNRIIHLIFDKNFSLPHQLESLVCDRLSAFDEFYFKIIKVYPEIKFY